ELVCFCVYCRCMHIYSVLCLSVCVRGVCVCTVHSSQLGNTPHEARRDGGNQSWGSLPLTEHRGALSLGLFLFQVLSLSSSREHGIPFVLPLLSSPLPPSGLSLTSLRICQIILEMSSAQTPSPPQEVCVVPQREYKSRRVYVCVCVCVCVC